MIKGWRVTFIIFLKDKNVVKKDKFSSSVSCGIWNVHNVHHHLYSNEKMCKKVNFRLVYAFEIVQYVLESKI
jgi:hypothetical protein